MRVRNVETNIRCVKLECGDVENLISIVDSSSATRIQHFWTGTHSICTASFGICTCYAKHKSSATIVDSVSTDSTQYSFCPIRRNLRSRMLVPRINWLRWFWTVRINQSHSIKSFREYMRWSQYVLSLQSVACAFRSTFIKIFDYNRMINVTIVPIRYDDNDDQDLFIRKVSEAINCFVNLEIFTNLFFFFSPSFCCCAPLKPIQSQSRC